eukprot:COSAG01_NODE_15267_length_1355_cov_227.707803_2_plen_111_part_00
MITRHAAAIMGQAQRRVSAGTEFASLVDHAGACATVLLLLARANHPAGVTDVPLKSASIIDTLSLRPVLITQKRKPSTLRTAGASARAAAGMPPMPVLSLRVVVGGTGGS